MRSDSGIKTVYRAGPPVGSVADPPAPVPVGTAQATTQRDRRGRPAWHPSAGNQVASEGRARGRTLGLRDTSYTRVVKLVLGLLLALYAHAQTGATPKPDVTPEAHLKAVKLVQASGAREQVAASIPNLIEQGKAEMQKRCTGCDPAFIEEWGKRMVVRVKVDDFVDAVVVAYEKRFTADELTGLLDVVNSRKTEKPLSLSPALQKKVADLMPAIMGEIVGRSTEIGAKLGSEVGAEIEKEHPEYTQPKAKPDKP